MQTYFLYKRDEAGRPRVTICLKHDEEKQIWYRGVAVCSEEDYGKLSKKEGRRVATKYGVEAILQLARCSGTRLSLSLGRMRDRLICLTGFAYHAYGGLTELTAWEDGELDKLKAKRALPPESAEQFNAVNRSCVTCRYSVCNNGLRQACIKAYPLIAADCINGSARQPVNTPCAHLHLHIQVANCRTCLHGPALADCKFRLKCVAFNEWQPGVDSKSHLRSLCCNAPAVLHTYHSYPTGIACNYSCSRCGNPCAVRYAE